MIESAPEKSRSRTARKYLVTPLLASTLFSVSCSGSSNHISADKAPPKIQTPPTQETNKANRQFQEQQAKLNALEAADEKALDQRIQKVSGWSNKLGLLVTTFCKNNTFIMYDVDLLNNKHPAIFDFTAYEATYQKYWHADSHASWPYSFGTATSRACDVPQTPLPSSTGS